MLTSLTKIVSDNDDRPTKRKYVDKHGNVSKINESDKTDEDHSELDFDIARIVPD